MADQQQEYAKVVARAWSDEAVDKVVGRELSEKNRLCSVKMARSIFL